MCGGARAPAAALAARGLRDSQPALLTLLVAHHAESWPYRNSTVSGMLILHLKPLSYACGGGACTHRGGQREGG